MARRLRAIAALAYKKEGTKNIAEYQTKSTIHFVKSYEKTACEYGLFFPHV